MFSLLSLTLFYSLLFIHADLFLKCTIFPLLKELIENIVGKIKISQRQNSLILICLRNISPSPLMGNLVLYWTNGAVFFLCSLLICTASDKTDWFLSLFLCTCYFPFVFDFQQFVRDLPRYGCYMFIELVFLGVLPSKYQEDLTLLSFRGPTRLGTFSVV